MRYEYDDHTDCAYIRVADLPHHHSQQIDEHRFVDYAEDGTVIGIELLYVGSGVDVSGLPFEDEVAKLLEQQGVRVYR